MSKALKIIAIIMPFVVFVLFFIPVTTSVIDIRGIDNVWLEGGGDYYKSSDSCYDNCVTSIEGITSLQDLGSVADDAITRLQTTAACTIAFFIIAFVISVTLAFLSQKKSLLSCVNIVPSSFFWVWAIATMDGQLFKTILYRTVTPHASFYISLILSAFFLAVFIAYAVKWLKARLASIPPREHKPTKSERIAELERQVAELTKEKDAE